MLNHNPADILAAGPDAVLIAAGHAPRTPHPLAEHYADSPLTALARAAAELRRPASPHENPRAIVARGAATADFSNAVGAALRVLAWHTFEGAADHRAFCAEHEVRDFKPVEIVAAQSDLDLVRTREFGEHVTGRAWSATLRQDVRLDTYATTIGITRQDLVNDDVGALTATLAEAANLAALTEANLVFGQLAAPSPVYASQKPFWLEGFNDLIGDNYRLIPPGFEALDSNGLAKAMHILRGQRTAMGRDSNYSAGFLVVSGALEYGARRLVKAADLPIQVVANSRLETNNYFVIARKDVQPVVATLKLRGTKNPQRVEPMTDDESGFDGVLFKLAADLGATLLTDGRGIVRHREAT